jgi:hypothetical protein
VSSIDIPLSRGGFGRTARRDRWWVQPLVVFLALSSFLIYANWAALQGEHYRFGPYLSPFYSPEIWETAPAWWPSFLPFTSALVILWAPAGFRLTCYYYRGAYYKAFWADPISCTVGEPRKRYRGENSLPLILQNLHRYFLYVALVFLVILAYDAWKAMWFEDGFGIGVGTLVLAVNVGLLGSYTLGCHSLRHLIGGRRDALSAAPVQQTAYRCATCLNQRHMLFAWMSLVWVAFSDIYVRLCSMGLWKDWRLL